MKGKLLHTILALLIALPLVMLLTGSIVWNYMQTPARNLVPGFEFEVEQGASLRTVADELASQQVLGSPRLFALWGRLTGSAGRIKAGVYELEPGMTLADILRLMEEGKVRLYAVTILEGWTIAELLAELRTSPAIVSTLDPAAPDLKAVLQDGVADSSHPEGRFFPDTYMVPRNTADTAVLKQANELLAARLMAAWESRQPDLPLENPYELLILASIVEREAALDSERAQIAGVFIRRLQRGMRLQTDPTVIYGLGDAFDGDLTREHLVTDTPYNTYTRGGLPPTPIGLPGDASLRAAANPEPGETLFFVASGKGDGSHVFSATLTEHNAAVAAYLREQRARQRAPVLAPDEPGSAAQKTTTGGNP